ncbi:septal ring lytic transglycosylase RlpA family protein [Candidatus Cytomitobacter indipagum]|uniref:Endolytic peptidoglycan transglycosylase RlpA n=1 Tax=Candidatus Cytomitobacter indipagum TaxID=2601575 RepID=A0A5C0UDU0_9PROT|nr:septal ring lytic transglycosylase RlpA family protein [Candidatus Cytomitobacter indipagum]QEK37803.1 septal ring lytic transglycosylase RlpA family protein [Candidatus Cytomitobacter indipagum]
MQFVVLLSLMLYGCVQKWEDAPRRSSGRDIFSVKRRSGSHYTVKNSQGSFKVKRQGHYNLDEYGIASYYGGKFHNRKTAIGVVYNQWDMTSAHPTIPLPAVLKVSRTDTGKSIYVLAIDRGPFVKKGPRRVIDLSRGAAKALGMERQGVAHVRVQCLAMESERLRKNWPTHKRNGKIPYNLACKYTKSRNHW